MEVPEIVPDAAEIVVIPIETAVANPLELMVTTALLDDNQVTEELISRGVVEFA